MAQDIAAKGWQIGELATRSELAGSTISRFLNGHFQTMKTAKKISAALGYSVRRYLVSAVVSQPAGQPEQELDSTADRRQLDDRRSGDDRRATDGRA